MNVAKYVYTWNSESPGLSHLRIIMDAANPKIYPKYRVKRGLFPDILLVTAVQAKGTTPAAIPGRIKKAASVFIVVGPYSHCCRKPCWIVGVKKQHPVILHSCSS